MVKTPGRSAVRSGTWPGKSSNSPSSPGACTLSASWCATTPRGVTRLIARMDPSATLRPLRQLGRLRADVVDRAGHLERLLRQVVALAAEDLVERADRVLARAEDALDAGERLGDVERLAHELLDLACARDRELVVFGQLVHAEDRDDVLEILVALQDALDLAGDLVVVLADDGDREDRRGRVERIDGRVDALLRDRAVEHGRRIEVGERGRRRGIGEIVGGHVDGLHRGDRAALRRGDALLETAHLGRERRLVTDGARDAAEERRHFGARLREAEDVVDEQEEILL